VLEAVFIFLEFSSPSRRIFYRLPFTPPSLVRRIGPSTWQFKRLHENRVNMRTNTRTCFKCGKARHYFAECPKVNNDDKHKFEDKRKKSNKKDHGHGNKTRAREKMKRLSASSPTQRTRLQARVMKTKRMTRRRGTRTSGSISTASV
jgi:hypothetical protein